MFRTKVQILENPTDVVIVTKSEEIKVVMAFFDEDKREREVIIKLSPGANSKLYFFGVCRVSGTGKLSIKSYQIHNELLSWSDLLCKTVVRDHAKFEYRGIIEVTKRGQKSHAYQRNENLVLSEEASVLSEPNLEILANDVFCTHGSTTGYIQDEQMFYLASRGFSREKIENIVSSGFLESVFDKLTDIGVSQKRIVQLRQLF